jgi:diaminopimelate epimerase
MRFTKMHGLGNDFIVVTEHTLPKEAPELARRLCDRRLGVGADGLVFLLPSRAGDVRMRILNADGSEAEQCGNAVRCVAKYYYERISGEKKEIIVETGAGLQPIRLETDGSQVESICVDMGQPILEASRVPVALEGKQVVDHPVTIGEKSFRFTAVSMGNPHAVIFVDDAADFPVETWGPRLETHPLFPNKTNVEFVTIHSPRELEMRVWERGVGPTLACGTGACASLVAAVLNGAADRRARVRLKGGDLEIQWSERDDRVYMTGPARMVFEGEWGEEFS